MDIYYIIKSNVKNEEYWGGKGFCAGPAKIYYSFEDLCNAINGHWFNRFNYLDDRVIKIISLSEKKKDKLLKLDLIRF